MSLGDFDTSTVIYGKFTTYRPSTGAPYTLAGTPALSVYKDNSTTQSTTGVTLTADFDSVTGLNHFAIDTSADGTFYSAGSFFDIVITTGTVDSVSAVGTVVGRFTLRKNSALKPTTAGRTLDVSSGGEAGVDWANVGSPNATLSLTATTIYTATNLTNAPTSGDLTATMKTSVQTAADAAVTANSLVNAISGYIDTEVAAIKAKTDQLTFTTANRVDSQVFGIQANAITASAVATDAVIEIQSGLSTLDAAGVRTAIGLASANLDTQLTAIDDYLDTEVAAIKAKTDSLTFTVAGQVDANIQSVNDVTVTGDGQTGTEWGPG